MTAESVLITGTTSGVGRALLEHYAARGADVICVNRREVPELAAQYPAARFECVDVRSADGVRSLVHRLQEQGALPKVLILNAGINRVDNDASFDLASYRAVVETNLYGALNFAEAVTQLPPAPKPRHVVAVSSLASYVGNPYGLGYHTSKRALSACFAAWSRMYTGTDLVFQRVMLGPVHTPIFTMEAKLPAWMVRTKQLFSVSPQAAASAIARFAQTRNATLHYPKRALPLYAAMGLGQSLIPGFFQGRNSLNGEARRRTRAT